MPFRILVVCTANSCRSPMAQLMLTADLAAAGAGEVAVSSAGTHAGRYGYAGRLMDARAAAELDARRVAGADSFRSRQLEASHAAAADLVLTADRAHRDAVVGLEPAAARRTFTLRELAFLLEDRGGVAGATPVERGAAVSRLAAESRGLRRPERAADFDLPDPVDGDPADFSRCADRILAATAPLVSLLAGQESRAPAG